ncbi:polynucleotide adenylyltransferase/metal dependent phosphohydrolase [Thermaerobacter marianensis DSM 12885]|uniref:Polynucleotide adenylyltransferase/metal dependent phosphohydrolase n=1 Tax=Thermaerobacter marianensis (strain ATCC 700841 / DSM 12885 / JCM 10246 / 7p75a) TaxID=644966 RepID=E6SLJ3_THEM7|nr:HD domain-containing protein [Thermaerobacter marianensis]ADU50260.1 polynucleotide adenylyltransferase/metal dependent phosphohydrolase [Thermaerobacter marianensis DSM 12885]
MGDGQATRQREEKLQRRQRERQQLEATRRTLSRLLAITRRCRTGEEFARALTALWAQETRFGGEPDPGAPAEPAAVPAGNLPAGTRPEGPAGGPGDEPAGREGADGTPPGEERDPRRGGPGGGAAAVRALAALPPGQRPAELARRFDRLVPAPVREVLTRLGEHGHAAYLVGGCVRDLLMARPPKDWDVATSARPEEVRRIFPRTIPTGIEHGTVTVRARGLSVEVTTFRQESGYSDFRHPDRVEFTRDLRADLERRDLTINAMALDAEGRLHDPLGGLADLEAGVVRAVGDPDERFREDALRLLRVVRFAARFGYRVEPRTEAALARCAPLIRHVSWERIREEMSGLLVSPRPAWGLELLRTSGLLEPIWPELLEGVGVAQNVHHAYTVWEHNLLACQYTPPVLRLRLAGLLHDVGKPRTVSVDARGQRHFYHHEVVGADMARQMLRRLKFDNDTVRHVAHLVRHHLALHHYPGMTDAAIRRLIQRIGFDYLEDLIILRVADRAASGTKRAPISRGAYRLLTRMEKILEQDAAFSLHDLAIDGHDVMAATGLGPGPAIGWILQKLLEDVLDEPGRNRRQWLMERAAELRAEAEARFGGGRRAGTPAGGA